MESFLNRYRNITVLLLVIFAQLLLLAMQVKNDQDVRVIRVWAVTTVTPVARIVEWFRGGSIGFLRHYVLLHDASQENRTLRDEVGRLRLENNFLRNELNTAERAKALQVFQARTPSKMLAANVIGMGAGASSQVVFVSRGSAEGVMRGMAVVTPDGIVGKVIAAYPTASEVMLVTDPEFSAGVISQKRQERGNLKGQGNNNPLCKVDYVRSDRVEAGEWFYTSGDDRIFPRGLAVGVAKVVEAGKDIQVEPSGLQRGLEDVLIILESVHQAVPDTPPANQPVYIAPAPPSSAPAQGAPANAEAQPPGAAPAPSPGTEADKLRSIYQSVGDQQNHTYGVGPPGTKPPDFTHLPGTPVAPGAPPAAKQSPAGNSGATPGPATKTGPPAAKQSPAGNPGPTPGGTPAPGAATKTGTPAAKQPTGNPGATSGPATKTGAPAPKQSPAGNPGATSGGSPAPGAATKSGAPAAKQPAANPGGAPGAAPKTGPPAPKQPPAANPGAAAPRPIGPSDPQNRAKRQIPDQTAPGGRSEPAQPPAKSGSPQKGPGGALSE